MYWRMITESWSPCLSDEIILCTSELYYPNNKSMAWFGASNNLVLIFTHAVCQEALCYLQNGSRYGEQLTALTVCAEALVQTSKIDTGSWSKVHWKQQQQQKMVFWIKTFDSFCLIYFWAFILKLVYLIIPGSSVLCLLKWKTAWRQDQI